MSEDVTSGAPDADEPTIAMAAVGLASAGPLTIPTPTVGEGPEIPPWDHDDGDDAWQARVPSNRVHMRLPTAILLGLLLAAGAFWGGAAVQKSHGSSSGLGGFASAAARLRGAATAGASGATGSSGFAALFGGGGGAAPTEGTVTEVQGSTLYITNSAGDIVKVELTPTATVTRTASTKTSGLQLGDTVIVEGSTAKDGTVTATSVSATAEGTTATTGRGGFGGAGG